jgi:hypothetical protein
VATRKKQGEAGAATLKRRQETASAERRQGEAAPLPVGPVDFSTPAGVMAYLETIAAGALSGALHPEAAKAAATVGRSAIALHSAGGGRGGAGKGEKTILPTVVSSMEDVRALREANVAALANAEVPDGVH